LPEINITSEEGFNEVLNEAGNAKVVALFTSPSWCVPCQRFEPHWNSAVEFADTNHLGVVFVKVDMGDTPEATGEHWATARFDILGVPQVKLINDGPVRDVVSRAVIPFLKEIGS
jgi:thiol-disulfide isomerase/thioredoxin